MAISITIVIAQIKRSQELSNLAWEMAVETAGEGYSGGSAEEAAEMQSLADGCDEAYDAAITVLEKQYQGWASARIHLTEAKSLESDGGDASHAISALDALDEYLDGSIVNVETSRAELLSALLDHDRGDGCLGIIVDTALADDPNVTLEDVRAIVLEAEHDAAVERERA